MCLSQKQELNGQSLEFTRSPGRMKLERVETSIFREVRKNNLHLLYMRTHRVHLALCLQRLRQQTPRQVDLNFEELVDKFKERQRVYEEGVTRDRQRQAEK